MLITIIFFTIAACAAISLAAELRRDLMMMQQNSYRIDRYRRWLRSSADTTSWPRLTGMAVALASLAAFATDRVGMTLIGAFAIGNIWYLSTRRYKKPLVMTPRARRIYTVSAIISIAVAAVAAIASSDEPSPLTPAFAAAVALQLLYCASHIVIMAAVWLLQPLENRINRRYRDDAARILASCRELKVVGITGSYGKTSTKHYLKRILDEHFATCMTPGSYNTTMGVVRTIREYLKPYDEVFIVEMGAKQPGDIKEICDLVHPDYGILTAVGEQHLESFGSIENVQRTKFELVDSLPSDGYAAVNNDFPFAANREVANTHCDRYAVGNTTGAQWTATDITYSPQGTTFTVNGPDGLEMQLQTRLVGECNISNLLAAIAVAVRLGVPQEKIRFAVADIRQVEHRLSLRRTPGGITIIDDAFNSNPTGSAMALDVLSGMTGGKRIVVTPGMIELGERQEKLNYELGRKAASCADIAIIVGRYNREAIRSGAADGGMTDDRIIITDTFAQAQSELAGIMKPGDTVLYENDLPDTFK
ncbi:MAG: UDP-N-acetylmuramoyl-tripeptide--D-alanyl-D-alanine ligase [Paramuribaculum sp.]|nr:UDP-N-acetylmuramoyl-tripeptide--D-alanyl-D-alanine ligase [Paramuribaculum sp.]